MRLKGPFYFGSFYKIREKEIRFLIETWIAIYIYIFFFIPLPPKEHVHEEISVGISEFLLGKKITKEFSIPQNKFALLVLKYYRKEAVSGLVPEGITVNKGTSQGKGTRE